MQVNINILNELREVNAEKLLEADNKNYYAIPEGYFDGLESSVKANLFIISLDDSINPFKIPEGYFENLPGIVLDKVKMQAIITDQKNTYEVPAGYFTSFSDTVLKKIKSHGISVQQELEEISPILGQIPKTNVYSVPENYFQQVKPLAGISEETKQEAKVVSLGSKTRKWMNYAAAACVSAILLAGGYFFISGNKTSDAVNTSVVADAPPKQVDVQQQLAGLSDSEIEAYLKDNSNISVFTNVGTDIDQQNIDIQTLIQNMPNDEIQQYLNEDDPKKKGEGT